MKRGLFIASAAAAVVTPALPVKAKAAALENYAVFTGDAGFTRAELEEFARRYADHFLQAGAVRADATVNESGVINCRVQWPAPVRFLLTLKVGSAEITPA